MSNDTEKKILIIIDKFLKKKGYNPKEFSYTEDLLNNGILDSLDVIEIILEIEKKLGFNVNTDNNEETINKKWFFNIS